MNFLELKTFFRNTTEKFGKAKIIAVVGVPIKLELCSSKDMYNNICGRYCNTLCTHWAHAEDIRKLSESEFAELASILQENCDEEVKC